MIRLLIFAAFLMVGIYTFVPMFTHATDLSDQRISLQQEKIGLRDLLTSLLDETKFKYHISNNVTNDKLISIDFRDAKWDEVFKYVLSEGNLNYRVTAKKTILVSP